MFLSSEIIIYSDISLRKIKKIPLCLMTINTKRLGIIIPLFLIASSPYMYSSAQASFTITVQDTPPSITAPSDFITEATAMRTALTEADYGTAIAAHISGIASIVSDAPPTFPLGSTTVKWTATDNSGTKSTVTQTITLVDTTPPMTNVPSNQIMEATEPSGASVTFSASAFDTVDGPITPTCAPSSGSTFSIGDTTVDCTATDAAGNTGEASFKVTVGDTISPTVTVPVDITVEATGSSGASVTFSTSAFDTVDGPITPTCAPSSGSTFSIGDTKVDCTATDAAGNTGEASFTITVQDTTSPDTTITSAVDGNGDTITAGGSTLSHSITFTFEGTDIVGVAGLECSLDSAGLSSCASSVSFNGLMEDNHTFEVRATDTSGNIDPSPASFTWIVLTPPQAVQNVSGELNDNTNNYAGTELEDKITDVQERIQKVLDELNKTPLDYQAAMGEIEGIVGDLEATIGEEPAVDPVLLDLMDQLIDLARVLATHAIDEAIVGGGLVDKIAEAEQSLADGDALRASGDFKDAVNKYKDAVSQAEGALP